MPPKGQQPGPPWSKQSAKLTLQSHNIRLCICRQVESEKAAKAERAREAETRFMTELAQQRGRPLMRPPGLVTIDCVARARAQVRSECAFEDPGDGCNKMWS